MSQQKDTSSRCLTPILRVENFQEAIDYYKKKLFFEVSWTWGKPPSFGCVRLGKVEIFFCLREQGAQGTWLFISMDNVDSYFARIKKAGAEVIYGPQDEPWGCREMHVRDPNQHVIRFAQDIIPAHPKLPVKRVLLKAKIERRLASLIQDLARHKHFTIGEILEETLLHTFERVSGGGVASPHTEEALNYIQHLKRKHGIDYDTHASYRFVEKSTRKLEKRVSR